MLSLIKFNSVEATDFNGLDTTSQICHFDIPSDGLYDLSMSCIVLPITLDTTEVATASGTGSHNVSLRFKPHSLVKNCQMTCSNGGILETNTHQNFLNVNLDRYRDNTADGNSNALFDGRNFEDEFGGNYSVFRTLYRTGTTAPVENSAELRIPLSDLFSIGSFKQFPAMVIRNTRIRLEFQTNPPAVDGVVVESNVAVEVRKYTDHTDNTLACDNIAADPGQEITTLTVTPTYNDDRAIPLFVGQKINVQYTVTGSAVADKSVVISEIARNAGSGKVTLTVPSLVTTDNTVTAITIKEKEAASILYNIKAPQILLYKINPTPSQLSSAVSKLRRGAEFPFRSYSLEQDSLQETHEFNRQYYLEPNVNNAILWGQLPSAYDQLESSLDHLSSYRCAVNGVDTTSIDVVPNSCLYRDRLLWTMSNAGVPLRQLRGNDDADTVCNTIPLANVQQQYSVQLRGDGTTAMTARNIHLYKQVNHVLKVSGNSVQVN